MCCAEDLPFFLEILTYDCKIANEKSREYAKIKPHKVNEPMKVFSQPRFNVDVLKVEVPVNMNFVEGYCKENEFVYSIDETKKYLKNNKIQHIYHTYI